MKAAGIRKTVDSIFACISPRKALSSPQLSHISLFCRNKKSLFPSFNPFGAKRGEVFYTALPLTLSGPAVRAELCGHPAKRPCAQIARVANLTARPGMI